ncbi:MAG: hypothetical protein KKF44_00580 [Nanoarchaeota archaeon]|nr:hypothetical protein [Nanoarchaeota archaeon]
MPETLLSELREYANKNHFLDVSEELRSILRERWLEQNDPYSTELEKLRKNIEQVTMPEKIEALKSDLKKLLEELK